MGKGSRMTFRAGSSSPSGSRLQTRVGSLKTRSDVARKMHQPGLFCFAHAKNAADRKDPIYCVLRSQLRKSEQTLSMAFGALNSSKFLLHHIA